MSNLIPIGARILVEQEKAEVKAIIVSDDLQTKKPRGVIKALGDSVHAPLAVDDIICFQELAGQEIKIGDETFLIIREQDVIAKIC